MEDMAVVAAIVAAEWLSLESPNITTKDLVGTSAVSFLFFPFCSHVFGNILCVKYLM
jgi:hypothetical protein